MRMKAVAKTDTVQVTYTQRAEREKLSLPVGDTA